MKTSFYLPILCLAVALPVQAQLFPDSSGNANGSGAPQRDIMPQVLKHKPNPTAPPPEIGSKIDAFFKALNQKDFAGAYQNFLAGSRLGSQNEKVSAFISKTQEAFGVYGPLYDDEVFDNYTVGSHVLVLTYLSRHNLQPLRWRFIYYQPGTDPAGQPSNNWVLINMGFDDYLMDELD